MDVPVSAGGGMTRVEGKVDVISEKKWNQVLLYSFKLEGNERWYRMGRTKPPFQRGDVIGFDERNGNVVSDIVRWEDDSKGTDTESTSAAAVAPRSAPSTTTQATQGSGSAVDVGQRMRYQAARRDAANVVVAALHTDALPWATNVAKSKKLDLLTDYIEQVTKTLLEQENKNAQAQ